MTVLLLSILFLPKGLVGEVSALDLIRRQWRPSRGAAGGRGSW